jgi:hypothetical protein
VDNHPSLGQVAEKSGGFPAARLFVVKWIGFRFGAEPAGSVAIAQHAFTSNDLVVEALLSQTDLLSKHPSNEPVQASSNELE